MILHQICLDYVNLGSTIYTDCWKGYMGLDTIGCITQTIEATWRALKERNILMMVHTTLGNFLDNCYQLWIGTYWWNLSVFFQWWLSWRQWRWCSYNWLQLNTNSFNSIFFGENNIQDHRCEESGDAFLTLPNSFKTLSNIHWVWMSFFDVCQQISPASTRFLPSPLTAPADVNIFSVIIIRGFCFRKVKLAQLLCRHSKNMKPVTSG
jgi:hypothetical protein